MWPQGHIQHLCEARIGFTCLKGCKETTKRTCDRDGRGPRGLRQSAASGPTVLSSPCPHLTSWLQPPRPSMSLRHTPHSGAPAVTVPSACPPLPQRPQEHEPNTHTRPWFYFPPAPTPTWILQTVNAHYFSGYVYKVAVNTELANTEPLLLEGMQGHVLASPSTHHGVARVLVKRCLI